MSNCYHLTLIPDAALRRSVRATRNSQPGLWTAPNFWPLPTIHAAFLLVGRQVEAAEAEFEHSDDIIVTLIRLWWRWGALARALQAFGAPIPPPPHRVELELRGDVPLVASCWTCDRHRKKQPASDGIPLPIWLLQVRAFTSAHPTNEEVQP